MSLSLRLGLFVTLAFLVGILIGLVRSLIYAQEQVQAELNSNAEFTSQLFSLVLQGATPDSNQDGMSSLLEKLNAIVGARYIILQQDAEAVDVLAIEEQALAGIKAPRWFVEYVLPLRPMPVQRYVQENGDMIILGVDPSNEIERVWADTQETMVIRFSAGLFLNFLAFVLLRFWLKPTDAIIEVLGDVERGDFSRRVPTINLPEFNRIAQRINHLTSILGASKAESERLTRTSLTIQEQERRYVAQELHDSLGQSLSAIKAIAVSIAQSDRGIDTVSVNSAHKIEQIADTAYSSVRKIMSTLRPPVLDELGLVPALQNMVDEWNDYHEDTFCRLRIDASFDALQDEQTINIYRIIQEALTNIAKHANAENVTLVLSGREVITLSINDDGQGYDPTRVEKGMGLMGLRERVQALQGEMTISSRLRKGVNIQIEFPRALNNRRRASDC